MYALFDLLTSQRDGVSPSSIGAAQSLKRALPSQSAIENRPSSILNGVFRWIGTHRGPVSATLAAPLGILLLLGGGAPVDPLAIPLSPRGLAGLLLVLAGTAVRLWAMGYRTKTGHFAEDGPYRWVRHPLYVGTLILWLGFFVLAGAPVWGTILFVLIAAGVHGPQVVFEEEYLCGLFGEGYVAYARRVPRWFPVRPPREPARRPWSLRRMLRNHALLTLVQAAALLVGFKLLVLWRSP